MTDPLRAALRSDHDAARRDRIANAAEQVAAETMTLLPCQRIAARAPQGLRAGWVDSTAQFGPGETTEPEWVHTFRSSGGQAAVDAQLAIDARASAYNQRWGVGAPGGHPQSTRRDYGMEVDG